MYLSWEFKFWVGDIYKTLEILIRLFLFLQKVPLPPVFIIWKLT